MDILRTLFDHLGDVVSTFERIANVFTLPLATVVEEFPVIQGLVGIGMMDVLLDTFPDITLFGMMFASALGFTIVYSLIKWFLDIIL